MGAWIVSIPDCVLGGMLAFLFSAVAVSGIKVRARVTGLPGRMGGVGCSKCAASRR